MSNEATNETNIDDLSAFTWDIVLKRAINQRNRLDGPTPGFDRLIDEIKDKASLDCFAGSMCGYGRVRPSNAELSSSYLLGLIVTACAHAENVAIAFPTVLNRQFADEMMWLSLRVCRMTSGDTTAKGEA